MTVKDIVKVAEPDFMRVRVSREHQYVVCPKGVEMDCWHCEFDNGDKDCGKTQLASEVRCEYEGKVNDVPLRLANERVIKLRNENYEVPKKSLRDSEIGRRLYIELTAKRDF